MKERMNIYYLDQGYQDYIRPHTKYAAQAAGKEEGKRRTSGVVLFGFGGTRNYFVPLRIGEEEQKKSEMGLTHGLNKGKNGYLDFSNMVPVQNKDLHLLDISNLPMCNLKRNLQRQARYIQREQRKIMEGAAEVYLNCVHYPGSKIASECNDILVLEEKERLWREGKVQKTEKKAVVKPTEEKKTEDAATKPTEKSYKETSTYKLAVEKYGQKVADKMIADALKQAMTQEKEDKKTEKKQAVATTSKKTVKKAVMPSSKKSTSSEKGTVTTVTIQSSPVKGK